MIRFSKKYRSKDPEIMDSFDLQGQEMEILLNDLKTVNALLGGNTITINGIKQLLKKQEHTVSTIVDVGCGDGELLRQCASYAAKVGWECNFIGIDGNGHILKTAAKKSVNFKNISYQQIDVLSSEILNIKADIFLCTLFLHHFDNDKITLILERLLAQSTLGVVVNDLQRSKTAFNLFKVFSAIFIKTDIAKHDGLVSVARGFLKSELLTISEKLQFKKQKIQWKWAFRFQWILFKT